MRISDWSSDVCSSDLLRAIFLGNLRFEQIQAHTGATPKVLTVRLKRLEATGMVVWRLYRERPTRHEYRPTAKGQAFHAVLLTRSEERHLGNECVSTCRYRCTSCR